MTRAELERPAQVTIDDVTGRARRWRVTAAGALAPEPLVDEPVDEIVDEPVEKPIDTRFWRVYKNN